jgi:hypothetical protein
MLPAMFWVAFGDLGVTPAKRAGAVSVTALMTAVACANLVFCLRRARKMRR